MYNIKSGVDNIQNVKNQNRLTYPEGESVFSNYKVTYKNGEIWYVQKSESNRHYQEILEWVADGNVIEEAD